MKEEFDALFAEHQKLLGELQAMRAVAQPEQDNTYGYASRLATAIWQKHYMKDSPNWRPLNTTEGVLTQIDNMTCGLIKEKPAQPEQEPLSKIESAAAKAVDYRSEYQKPLTVRLQQLADRYDFFKEEVHRLESALAKRKNEPVITDWNAVHKKLELVWYRELSADEGLDEIQDLIYTSPPPVGFAVMQKPWVGLTDEEFDAMFDNLVMLSPYAVARVIEAKLKEKNT